MSYTVSQVADSIVSSALKMANEGVTDIKSVLDNVQDSKLTTSEIPAGYGVTITDTAGLSINTAAGAMVVDDLMQKISTKVQVAAQLLSTANNINKNVSRALSQG